MKRAIVPALAGAVLITAGAAWWLATGGVGEQGSLHADPDDAELVALGARVYAENCAACHGGQLEGQPNWRNRKPDGRIPAPPHDASGHTWHHDDATLFTVTKFGPQAVAGPDYESDMPAYEDILSDREIWAVLAYIKSTWPAGIRARQAGISQRAKGNGS